MPQARQSVVVDVPRDFFFDVISDFAAYPQFIPSMKVSRVERVTTDEQGRRASDVAYRLDLVKTLEYTLRLVEHRPERLEWNLVRGDIMSENHGYWALEALGPASTRATYAVTIGLRGFFPSAVVTRLVGVQLPEMLQQFKSRAESLWAARAGAVSVSH